jgi:uncharacterized protein (TIGR02588 family)
MPKRGHRQIPAAEWLASLIGGAIVLGTIGFLLFETVQRSDQEPALTVAVVQVRETGGSFVVDVEVRNASRGAAADVQLGGADRAGGQLRALARLDYVPGFSSRRASLVFDSDPGPAPAVRVVGYARP